MFERRLLARFGREPEAAKAALERELAAFGALPETLAAVWLLPRAPGAWSPAQVTEHVLKVNVGMSKTLHLLRRDAPLPEQARIPGVLEDGKAQAPAFSHPGAAQPWDVLEPQWLEMERRLLDEVAQTRDWEERSRFHPYFGELNALGWTQAAALHMAHHRLQLGAA
jgi:hypothetical protein